MDLLNKLGVQGPLGLFKRVLSCAASFATDTAPAPEKYFMLCKFAKESSPHLLPAV